MWEFFALSAALTWALVTILDKILLERHIPSGPTYLILHGIIGMLPVAGMLIMGRRIDWGDGSILGLVLLSGILESIFVLLYYQALQTTDASMVALYLQGVPVITIGISLLFFHEIFSLVTYLGVAVTVLGTGLAILVASPGRPHLEWKALRVVLPALLAISVSYSLQSSALRVISVDTFFIVARIGQMLFGMAMLCLASVRHEFRSIVAELRPTILLITVAIGLLNLFGVYLLNQAYALGSLALVTTLSSIQPILILLIVSFVNSIRPQTIPDEGSQKFFWRRILVTMLVIIGIYLALV